jgi:hypothetical protein
MSDERQSPRVDPEPSDNIDPVLPDRPRIWPETPRPLKTQVKRPMDEWLQEFSQRITESEGTTSAPSVRRRRARGLARLIPSPARPQPMSGRRAPDVSPQPPDERRRGRRRRGRGGPMTGGSSPNDTQQGGPSTATPERHDGERRRSRRGHRPRGGGKNPAERLKRPPGTDAPLGSAGEARPVIRGPREPANGVERREGQGPPAAGGETPHRRRRGRGRRGRGRGGAAPGGGGGSPPSGGTSPAQ